MSPTELFKEARLDESLAAQRAVTAAQPADVAERLLLCELLAFAGDRDEVRRQLALLTDSPADVREYVGEWQRLLAADDARHAGAPPQFLTEPPQHVRSRLRAAGLLAAGREAEALDLLDDCDESAAWAEGYVDGRPFDGWRDADDLFGPVLEAFHGDQYVWIPIEQIRKLRLEEDGELRDMLYRPATVWWADGRSSEVFIPGVYTGTAGHPEEGIRSGAGVDWMDRGGLLRGLGARTYLIGEEEMELPEFRQVEVRYVVRG